MRKYYFRVDGGNIYSIATGHIARCLKLAEYINLREKTEICFIMKDYPEGIDLVRNKFEVFTLDKGIGKKDEARILRESINAGSYFICDLRGVDDAYISEIKKTGATFILFDDMGIENVHPDILINPTPFCYEEYNRNKYPGMTLLLGEEFFFIRPELSSKAYSRNFIKDRRSIMASFGGADPLNITEFFIQKIVPKLGAYDISIVLGPAYAKKEEIINKYGALDMIRFFTQVFPLDSMLLNHDIVFVCGGDTCVEATRSGAATFIISSIDYEKKLGQLLDKKGMAYFVADIEDIKSGKFSRDYLGALKNKERLKSLSFHGMTLVDGRGLERIYNYLQEKK